MITQACRKDTEALDLVERAFDTAGGWKGAFAEARDGVHGGLRAVLDAMTQCHKHGEQAKRVRLVLRGALDPLDWDGKVALMGALMDRLAPHLPPELVAQPPESLAKHYELVVQAYVSSFEKVRALLRCL